MGRPQKPFVVEVKRGRRGAGAALPSTMSKPREAAPEAAKRRPAPPPEPPKPQRRILDAIELPPAPVTPSASAPAVLELFEAVAADSPKRRRGRPPKTADVPAQETKPPAKARPAMQRRDQAAIVPVARREFLPVPDGHDAPSRVTKIAVRADGHGQMTHGHMTHDDREEAAASLPRGERWKRRLPKVLW